MKLNKLFVLSYGTKFDLNKMIIAIDADKDKINFVSRSSKNLGVVAKVKKISDKEPHPAGLITVTLGGTYLLSAFVQPNPFYTAQNIIVLTPKNKMSFEEKIFYCMCIAENRFRYISHGREANRTLKTLELPDKVPNFVKKGDFKKISDNEVNTVLEFLDEI